MQYVRPDWVRRLDAMAVAVGGPAAMVRLDADDILATAQAATGLHDAGDPGWEEPFRRLVASLDGEAQLTVVGRLMSRHDVLRHLCTRLRLVEARKRHPGIDDEVVVAPVFVTGPARSGTTILQELIAEDPALRGPRGFEMAHPLPFDPETDPELDRARRLAAAESEFDLWCDVQPEFRAVHELAAALPEECLWLFAPEFDHSFWSTCTDVPSFAAWRSQSDPVDMYRAHRSFLQCLQHGAPPRTWALKSPMHLGRLPALFAVYPDARVIVTHRDPVRSVPSTVSAVAGGRWLRSDAVDPVRLAATLSVALGAMFNGAVEERATLPAGQIADLHYLELLRDPAGAIGRAYEHLGLPAPSDHAARITRYLAARPQSQHGVHRYGAREFGLDPDVLRRDFAPYVDGFGVEHEDP
jgi:hypothetical protein